MRPLRVKIISPLTATEADLARRQRRYAEHARSGTEVRVVNLEAGPAALDTAGDLLESAAAICRAGAGTTAAECDAILIDCVFDPAVAELAAATGIPTFGPLRLTLPLVALVASRVALVARTARQGDLLAATVERYGYGNRLGSVRALGLGYEEAKRPELFEAAMCVRLRQAVVEDEADAVVFGSTTMALSNPVVEAAGGVPLFMPGMVALRVLEHLWRDGLWPRAAIR